MIIISYDISNNKKRTKFNKFIKRFGRMLQYSVYEIENSERILNNIIIEINNNFLDEFDENDSVYVFKTGRSCEILKFGHAKHEDEELIIIK